MRVRIIPLFISLLVLLGLVLPGSAVSTSAQGSSQTIADIVVASTTASQPEFTVLLAAVQAADPAFLTALSDPNGNYTVFAPTDAAFTQLLKDLNLTADQLLANKSLLDVVLAYHVIPARFDAKTVVSANGAIVGTLLADHALTISVDGSKAQVDSSNIVKTDIQASNGIVHVIDKVLVPADVSTLTEAVSTPEATAAASDASAPVSIAETVVNATKATTPEFTTLLAAVQAADPAVLSTLGGSEPLTVFAPTDAAFGAALTALNTTAADLLADQTNLTNILLYHVAPGSLSSKALAGYLGTNTSLKVLTLSGNVLTVSVSGSQILIDKATVVTPDVAASNGVIHIIDGVLLPPAS